MIVLSDFYFEWALVSRSSILTLYGKLMAKLLCFMLIIVYYGVGFMMSNCISVNMQCKQDSPQRFSRRFSLEAKLLRTSVRKFDSCFISCDWKLSSSCNLRLPIYLYNDQQSRCFVSFEFVLCELPDVNFILG